MVRRPTHEELEKKLLADPEVKAEYDALEEEFTLLEEMIKARKAAKKTQADVAKAMHTNTSVVGRLEMSGGKRQHSPSLATLRRYARAVGCDLRVKFVPKNKKRKVRSQR